MIPSRNIPSGGVSQVQGIHLLLRLVKPSDSEYIHGLRTNPDYNAYLSPVSGTVWDQRAWIEDYKLREANGLEYYYLIERLRDKVPCGVVRLYNIESNRFTWGSWILDENKPRKAALESAVLSFGVGFEFLGKQIALIDVRKDNARAITFYRQFGMSEIVANDVDIYFEYTNVRYRADRNRYLDIVREAIE